MNSRQIKTTKIAMFKGSKIRKIVHKNEWYFSVVDIVAVLTNQTNFQLARNYWKVLKNRLKKEGSEVVTKCNRLKMEAEDGKLRETDAANVETILRLVQSIPSPKAEPIKLWLAKVGYERVQEIENPELATNEISKAAFGITPGEYKKLKGLKRENLRDHMDDFELIFTMLGERVTTEISQQEKPNSFPKNKTVAKSRKFKNGLKRKNDI